MELPTLEMLRKTTAQFLELHWNDSCVPEARPRTWTVWNLVDTIPNHSLQGCYAILTDREAVLYIGAGASRGHGLYRGFGLAKRVGAYTRAIRGTKPKEYKLRDKWALAGGTRIATIGFPHPRGYLSFALEAYLLAHINPPPPLNRNRPGSKG